MVECFLFMRRYALLIEYNGHFFCGFQRQKDQPSVQECLENLLEKRCHHAVTLHAAGRTDTGVHALGQVVHFDTPLSLNPLELQGFLNFHSHPQGVSILEVQEVSTDFHARFSAKERAYIYRILNRSTKSALWHERSAFIRKPLNHEAMREGASFLKGHHNFQSFRSAHCQAKSAYRTLFSCTLEKNGPFLDIFVRSPSFLHNQVRIMVGSLILVGQEKKSPAWIQELLITPNRCHAGPTAPAQGLYFKHVLYDPWPFLNFSLDDLRL